MCTPCFNILCGDNLTVMPTLDENSVDSIVCDPPYGISFMNTRWDYDVPIVEQWEQAYRILKPGGHILVFCGARTQHRVVVNIEDVGFEIRDMLMWVYGEGFPKNRNISKAIDKEAGVEREVIGQRFDGMGSKRGYQFANTDVGKDVDITLPATPEAERWDGWGTGLKPSYEPVIWAHKPLTIVPNNVILNVQHLIGILLWELLLPVKRAELISRLNQKGLGEVCVSAHVIAEMCHFVKSGQPLEKMGMSRLPETDKIICNIVALWNNILNANYARQSMSTISMAIERTTELKILSLLVYQIIQDCTTKEKLKAFGVQLNAPIANKNLIDEQMTLAPLITAQDAAMLLKGLNTASNADQNFMVAANLVNTVLQNAITNHVENISPAYEPIVLARKPISEKTIAANVLKWGTGALNIDACRVDTADSLGGGGYDPKGKSKKDLKDASSFAIPPMRKEFIQPDGRWPANFLHDGSDEVLALMPDTKSDKPGLRTNANSIRHLGNNALRMVGYGDEGSAARYFYCAKTSKADRDNDGIVNNTHLTVKPTSLMRYLVRLITPPGGRVLDPWLGSGSTGKGAVLEGFEFIGIEKEFENCEIARLRIEYAEHNKTTQQEIIKDDIERATGLKLDITKTPNIYKRKLF